MSENANFVEQIALEAGERWADTQTERTRKLDALAKGRLSEAETPERLAKHAMRLAGGARKRAFAPRKSIIGIRPASGAPGVDRSDIGALERVIGDLDFEDVPTRELAGALARFVCRVRVEAQGNHAREYGTGFMVSPRLLLTNHHVLPTKDLAGLSDAQFDYQMSEDGQFLRSRYFKLVPTDFFLTDQALDYTLVAVAPISQDRVPLDVYTWIRMIEDEGKAVFGEPLVIIQHPGGGPKQIARRNNRLVGILENFLQYETDTERGSSGSPVFNQRWELVALHHQGVPLVRDGAIMTVSGTPWDKTLSDDLIQWVANEGVRISRIVEDLKQAPLRRTDDKRMRDDLFNLEPDNPVDKLVQLSMQPDQGPDASGTGQDGAASSSPPGTAGQDGGGTQGASISIPLTITITLGDGASLQPLGVQIAGAGVPAARPGAERGGTIAIDRDYSNRNGYQTAFLGTGVRTVSLPRLSPTLRRLAAPNAQPRAGDTAYLLRYQNFSIAMNARRKLAFFCASNIDGSTPVELGAGGSDVWYPDNRIPEWAQTDDSLYYKNEFDKGHIVRRTDPVWGKQSLAKRANDDTFHYTNCSPQHKRFNEQGGIWFQLEQHIQKQAKDQRLCVLSGPVFGANDPLYRGVLIPLQFWKIIAYLTDKAELAAAGFLLSQDEDVGTMPLEGLREEGFSPGKFVTEQRPISTLGGLTGLGFGSLVKADALADTPDEALLAESVDDEPPRGIEDVSQIVLRQ